MGCCIKRAANQPHRQFIIHRVQRTAEADIVRFVTVEHIRIVHHVRFEECAAIKFALVGLRDHFADGVDADVFSVGNVALQEAGSEVAVAATGVDDGAVFEAGEVDHDIEAKLLSRPAAPQRGGKARAVLLDRAAVGIEIGTVSGWGHTSLAGEPARIVPAAQHSRLENRIMNQQQPSGNVPQPPHHGQTPPPGYGYMPPPPPPPPPPPQRVYVTAKPGGFVRAVGFIFGLLLFGGIFLMGIVIGIAIMFGRSSVDRVVLEEHYQDGGSSRRIAIIPIEGIIDWNKATFVRDCVDHVLSEDFDAVVLRIDSPGGGVTSSDEIWYEVQRLHKNNIDVVASYGGIAASGGYYVSCTADHIMAQQTCITGSIGVIAQVMTFEGLLDKVGIEPITLVATNSPNKDVANDIFHSWSEQDRAKVIDMLDASYETFLKRVADGRGEAIGDASAIRDLADGSIYTAEQAKASGLIDSIGYLDDAVVEAERMIGLGPRSAEVVVLRYPPSLFGDGLLMQAHQRTTSTPLDAERIRTFANELAAPRLMYLSW